MQGNITICKNMPLEELDNDQLEQFQEGLWNLRKRIHEAGIAHNDMHAGNAYYDSDTGNVGLVDFGLAQDDPMAALMEAFGGHRRYFVHHGGYE